MRKLNAVLCGINEYEYPVTPLNGCVADVEQWEAYIKNQNDQFEVSITKLLNQEATKDEILSAIDSAMTSSSEGDVVFVYFSGHGTRETIDPVFDEIEQDDGMEAFVNYDGITFNGRMFDYNLLSDKELHYALNSHDNSGAHVLFVVDSCHSGGITRNLMDPGEGSVVNMRRHEATERMSIMAPMRRWEQFYFSDQLSRDDVEQQGWLNLVPQRAHVTMSACQNDESAYEVDGHGVFTSNMIKVLTHAQGAVTYRGLQARVRQYVRNQFDQTPEVYSTRHNADDLLRTFLDRTGETAGFMPLCYFRDEDGEWAIDIGSAQGVRPNSGPVQILFGDEEVECELGQIAGDYSLLIFRADNEPDLDPEDQYKARLVNYLNGSTSFMIDPEMDEDLYDNLLTMLDEAMKGGTLPGSLTDKVEESQYLVALEGNVLLIKHSGGMQYPVYMVKNSSTGQERLLDAMAQIAKWEFVRSYENTDIDLQGQYPVEIGFEYVDPAGAKTDLVIDRESVVLDFEQGSSLRLFVQNGSETKYYCSLLYLSNTFEVNGNLLDGKVLGIGQDEKAWVFNGQNLPLNIEKHVREFKMPESVSYIKLVANMEEFRVEALEMEALPAPTRSLEPETKGLDTRGLEMPGTRRVETIPWFTRTIALRIKNPEYSND